MIPILLLFGCSMLLCGCSMQNPTQMALKVREVYANIETIDAETTVFMDLGERTQTYRLSWTYDASSGSKVTVIEPDTISGISITTTDNALTFEYDDAVLVVPVSDGLSMQSPLEALPSTLRDYSNGVYTECSREKIDDEDVFSITYEDSEKGKTHRVWFRYDSLTPIISEIYLDGRMTMRISYDMFESRGTINE